MARGKDRFLEAVVNSTTAGGSYEGWSPANSGLHLARRRW